jgi:hypothetical protein
MYRSSKFHTRELIGCLTTLVLLANPLSAENWPRFRGPNGSGISQQKGLPITWSQGDIAWKTKLPGIGHSSPCIWDDHVFVTAAQDDGRKRFVVEVI